MTNPEYQDRAARIALLKKSEMDFVSADPQLVGLELSEILRLTGSPIRFRDVVTEGAVAPDKTHDVRSGVYVLGDFRSDDKHLMAIDAMQEGANDWTRIRDPIYEWARTQEPLSKELCDVAILLTLTYATPADNRLSLATGVEVRVTPEEEVYSTALIPGFFKATKAVLEASINEASNARQSELLPDGIHELAELDDLAEIANILTMSVLYRMFKDRDKADAFESQFSLEA